MKKIRLRLAATVDPTNTSIVVVGDTSDLPSTGYLYFEEGNDFLHYSGVSGNTLTGVSEMILVHEEDEILTDYYGILPSKILAGFELTKDSDPDGVASTLIQMMDTTIKDYMRIRRYLRAINNPLYCDDSMIDDLVKSLGIEFKDLLSDSEKRRLLALWASYLIQERGTAEAFNTLVYLTTGVYCTTRLIDEFVPLEMDSSYGILLDPTSYFPMNRDTLGLWYMDEGSGVVVENEMDSSGGTDGALSGAGLWVTTLGCSLFEKHTNIEFSGAGDTLIIPASSGDRTYLGSKSKFSLQLILKGKTGGAYPQNIISKSGVFSVSRINETDVSIEVTNGVDVVRYTVSDCLDSRNSTYLAILFNEHGLSVVKNYEVLVYKYGDGFVLNDGGFAIKCGDIVSGYSGYIDMIKLGTGEGNVADFLRWYEPLWYLLSSLTDEDRTTYFYSDFSVYNTVEVTLTDYTGTQGELAYIRDLAQIWLGAGDIIIHPAGNILLNQPFGLI